MACRRALWQLDITHWPVVPGERSRAVIWSLVRLTAEFIMSLQHKTKPIYGVQFHPESVMTEGGYQMLANWLETLGVKGALEKI